MAKIFLEVVTPDRVMVSEEVDSVVAPGSEGEFGVLPGHIHFLSGIAPGELRYKSNSDTECIAVMSGFAEVSDDKVSVLVDAAERACDIDIERARQAMDRAQQRITKEREAEDIDFVRAESALKRAIARLKVAEKNT